MAINGKAMISEMKNITVRSTTIVCVRHKNQVAMAGDGQVSFDDTIMKSKARKVRRMYNEQVVCGFAGAAADALALFERFEGKIDEYSGNLARAAVELAKEWRTDKYLQKLQALLVVADKDKTFLLSGSGDVFEPDDGVIAIGSGGSYALSAARALISEAPRLSAEKIATRALEIAGEICVFTNSNIQVEVIK
ncbi:MAG TPA: ATP-dependent protease subunit HslV [candidate division Zixibacteria bacterium]|nr:ATP-dependent protease subunit HslV [candidate division Zixibacteria bacterium]